MKKIILNHKSYLMYDEVLDYKKELNKVKSDEYEFIIFPQLVYIPVFSFSKYLSISSCGPRNKVN